MSPPSLLDVAGRLWEAAWSLDELRGDRAASQWAAAEVRELIRAGRADDARAILPLAEAVERRLARERATPEREEVEA